jgi:hypothetical protein
MAALGSGLQKYHLQLRQVPEGSEGVGVVTDSGNFALKTIALGHKLLEHLALSLLQPKARLPGG